MQMCMSVLLQSHLCHRPVGLGQFRLNNTQPSLWITLIKYSFFRSRVLFLSIIFPVMDQIENKVH